MAETKDVVRIGSRAAILTHMTDYGIPDPPFPKTVYRTPNPEFGVSECYEVSIQSVPGAPDPQRCWIVREFHGYFEDATKTYYFQAETLHPSETRYFMAFDDVVKAANQQVRLRAKDGFRFLFTVNYNGAPWYSRFEVILGSDTVRAMP